jgi:hypothetical protein
MAIKIRAIIMITFFLIIPAANLFAQNNDAVYFKWATKANRDKFYENIIKYPIDKNLSLPLADSTEDKWSDGVASIELLQYRTKAIDKRIRYAFKLIDSQSVNFQLTFFESVYSLYPKEFTNKMKDVFNHTNNSKVFAISAEYLYRAKAINPCEIKEATLKFNTNYEHDLTLKMLVVSKQNNEVKNWNKMLQDIFSKKFLRGNTVVYTIQRKNRDYIGITIIRDSKGNFIEDSSKNIIAIPQFARSLSNLPFYLTNGNTPQGIFKMRGMDISLSSFIGPTPNIQLSLPFEMSVKRFLNDNNTKDSIWSEHVYKKLLPLSWQDYAPIYQTYYAGKLGRTEIIAHGTTIDPEYYKTKVYYPYTPTEGCLCTKEIWSEVDGKRTISDQQKLVNTLKMAGNDNGYYVVIEIDDQQKPVTLQEILPYLKATIKN